MKERLGNTMTQENKKLRMMLIDAEEGIAERFQVYLSDHPEVELVKIITNGNEVVQAIKEYIPDIIIMDLLLPNGDGLSLLENLSQIQLTKEPFIIVILIIFYEWILYCSVDFFHLLNATFMECISVLIIDSKLFY